MFHRAILRTLGLGLVLTAPASATLYFVDLDAPGNQNGSTWFHAFHTLDDALAVAAAGDEIRVAGGTYRPGGEGDSWSWTWSVPEGVALRGSFGGFGAPAPNQQDLAGLPTLLDGDHAQDDLPYDTSVNRFDNSEHLITIDAGSQAVLLQGFFLRGGDDDDDFTGGGGAVRLLAGALTVSDCRFEDNTSRRGGGGIYAGPGTAVSIADCTFHENECGGLGLDDPALGGAVFLETPDATIVDSVFTDNLAKKVNFPNGVGGGALYVLDPDLAATGGLVRVERCLFEGNWAGDSAGAVGMSAACHLVDCDFVDNGVGPGLEPFSQALGGAFVNGPGETLVLRCRFLGNRTSTGSGQGGGGSAMVLSGAAVVSQCEIVGNGASDQNGAAVLVLSGDGLLVEGCTIAGNLSAQTSFPAGLRTVSFSSGTTVANSIVWGNVSAGVTDETAQVMWQDPSGTLEHCLIQGWTGALPGAGNIDGDPAFVDLDGADDVAGTLDDDVRLAPGSAAIDAGRSDLLPPDGADLDCDGDLAEALPMDVDGRARRVDDPGTVDTGLGAPVVDQGAHEFGASLPTEIWVDLGGGSHGALGQPALVGSGTFCEAQLVGLSLTNAPPGALVLLIEALESNPVPKWGGTVIPVPIFAQFLLATDGGGELAFEVPLLSALPPGLEVYYQYLVNDTTVSPPIILSNAVHAVTP